MQPKTILSVLAVFLIFASLVKATDITTCQNITSPGNYAITGNISVSSIHFPTCSDFNVSDCTAFSDQCYIPLACTIKDYASCILDSNCLWNGTDCNPNACLGNYMQYPPACINIRSNNVELGCNGFNIYDNCSAPYNLGCTGQDMIGVYEAANVTILGCSASAARRGIYLENSTNVWVDNSTSSNNFDYSDMSNTNTFGAGLVLESTNNSFITNFVANNNIHNNAASGIDILNSNNNILVNVTANDNSPYGIYLENSNFTMIINASVSGNPDGIYFEQSSNNTIASSNISSNYGNNIYFDVSSSNNITNSRINDGYEGIYTYGSMENNITNSEIKNSVDIGLYLENSPSNFISGLLVDNSSNAGIYLYSGSDNNTIKYSTISNTGSSGIVEDTSTGNLIYNNLFNNSANGIINQDIFNSWNTTSSLGGGNYWTNQSGSGYSNTCTDANHDGFCDVPYDVLNNTGCVSNCSNNTDYLPIALGPTSLVYNCSEGSPNSLTFATYDEDTNAAIIGNQTMAFNIYEFANDSFVGGYSFQYLNVYNATLCFSLSGDYFNSIEEYYSEPNYPMRTYYMNHAAVHNSNGQVVPLYLSQGAKLTFIHLEDGYGNSAPNDYIFANRYFVANNSYVTTDIVLTDAFGNATTYLIPNTVFYQFVVVGSNGQLLNSFSKQTISCDTNATVCSVTLKLPLLPQQEYWNYWGRVAYHCNVDESNKPASVLIDCTTADTSGLLHKVVLNTWLVNLFSNTPECNSSSFAPSSHLFCTIYNVSGNVYTYQLVGTFNDTVIFTQDTLDYRIRQIFGIYGVLPGLLLILSLTLLGAAISPVATIAGGTLGIGVSSVIGLLDLPISSIVAFIAVSLILIYKMR